MWALHLWQRAPRRKASISSLSKITNINQFLDFDIIYFDASVVSYDDFGLLTFHFPVNEELQLHKLDLHEIAK
jgi:hypothetical protein